MRTHERGGDHFDHETFGGVMALPYRRQIGAQLRPDSRVGADVGVLRVGGEESGDESFEFESAEVIGFRVGHGQSVVSGIEAADHRLPWMREPGHGDGAAETIVGAPA